MAGRARQALLQNVKSSGSAEIDHGVMKATLAELDEGFLKGPVELSVLYTSGWHPHQALRR